MSAREGRNLPSPSEGNSIRLRDVVGIVVAAVLLRAALEILAGSVYRGDAYYWSLLFQLVMYGVMFALLRRDALIVGGTTEAGLANLSLSRLPWPPQSWGLQWLVNRSSGTLLHALEREIL